MISFLLWGQSSSVASFPYLIAAVAVLFLVGYKDDIESRETARNHFLRFVAALMLMTGSNTGEIGDETGLFSEWRETGLDSFQLTFIFGLFSLAATGLAILMSDAAVYLQLAGLGLFSLLYMRSAKVHALLVPLLKTGRNRERSEKEYCVRKLIAHLFRKTEQAQIMALSAGGIVFLMAAAVFRGAESISNTISGLI